MSTIFGQPKQIGYVVPDIQKAMGHFVDVLGIGPWYFTDKSRHLYGNYRGTIYSQEQLDNLHLSTALAHSGEMQIELLSPQCNTPSLWQEFIASGNQGIHHWSSWEADYDSRKAQALANRYILAHEGETARGKFGYFEHPDVRGSIIEIAHYTTERKALCEEIREISMTWDGTDPIRKA